MAHFLLHAGQPSAKRLLRRVPTLARYQSASGLGENDVVIRWGLTKEADPLPARVLNARDAVLRTTSRAQMGRSLRRIGIRFPSRRALESSDSPRFLRQYRIPLFDLAPLACFRSDASGVWISQRIQRLQESFREVPVDDDKVTIRAVNLAMRVLHALGLDFGLVSIGMTSKGVLYVLDVTPCPVLEDRMLDLFASAIERHIDEEARWSSGRQKINLMLGTDVELMLRNRQGKMVLASKYFSRRGRVGCDDRSVRSDGQRLPLLELRPAPAADPLELLDNLRDTMMQAAAGIGREGVEWRAGSMPFRPYPTGGHIHFSGIPFSSHLVRVLDNYVGLPLMLVEDPGTAQLRRPRYGSLGDVRFKSHGGFEYRTPASFVVDAEVTAAAFCLAYVAALHHRELPVANLYDANLQLAFYRSDTAALRPVWERNLVSLSRISTFEHLREYIEPLVRMIEEGRTWDETIDVRRVWGIPLGGERKAVVRLKQASYAVSV